MKAPGDHEMDHREKAVPQVHHDALADAPQAADRAPEGGIERRIVRPQHEGVGELHAREGLAHDAFLEGLEVDRDVGELRHSPS